MAASSASQQVSLIEKEDRNQQQQQQTETNHQQQPTSSPRRKRRLPGTPKEDAEVVALTAAELLASHRFECEVCKKRFQRKQNLQLHMRGHNDSTPLMRRDPREGPPRKKVYVCPEPGCVYHDPARALGDMTGIKKHYARKHGERRYPCEVCSRSYAVLDDLKAHSKTCTASTRSRAAAVASSSKQNNLITHKSTCDVLLEGTTHTSPINNTSNASLACTRSASALNIIENALPTYSLNNFASLNTTCGEHLKSAMHASSVNASASANNLDAFIENTMPNSSYINASHASSLSFSTYLKASDAIPESVRHAPSPKVASFSAMPRSSLSAMFAPSLNVASTSLTNFDNHPFYGSKSQQSEKHDTYSNPDIIEIFSLSKDHPMLK